MAIQNRLAELIAQRERITGEELLTQRVALAEKIGLAPWSLTKYLKNDMARVDLSSLEKIMAYLNSDFVMFNEETGAHEVISFEVGFGDFFVMNNKNPHHENGKRRQLTA
jgi:DNA-binding Xre family transcriptional regulator